MSSFGKISPVKTINFALTVVFSIVDNKGPFVHEDDSDIYDSKIDFMDISDTPQTML